MKKLSELRPCDNCGGPVVPVFYVIRLSPAVIQQHAVQSTIGLMQYFSGRLDLAEIFTPEPHAIDVAMDSSDAEKRSLQTEIVLCTSCYCGRLSLAELVEKLDRRAEERRHGDAAAQ